MQRMDDNSIDLVVTSPPYDNLRTYLLDELVVWRYDVENEKKQEIIKELKKVGVAPLSTSK